MHSKLLILLLVVLNAHSVAWAKDVRNSAGIQKQLSSGMLKTSYLSGGSGPQALLFLHGLASSAWFWREQIGETLGSVHWIAPDLHASWKVEETSKGTLDPEIDVQVIEAILRQEKVESVVLIGHSLGALLAHRFAQKFPGQVSGIVVADGLLRPPGGNLDAFNSWTRTLETGDYGAVFSSFIDSLFADSTPETLRREIKTAMLSVPQSVVLKTLRSVSQAEVWDLKALSIPTLAIDCQKGLSDGKSSGREAEFGELYSNLKYQALRPCGHFSMLERPQEFNAATSKFVQERFQKH